MLETMRDLEEGKIKPKTVFDRLVAPMIEKMDKVSFFRSGVIERKDGQSEF